VRIEVRARVEHPGGFRMEIDLATEARALGVVGPSGSGKSTLLDIVAGAGPEGRVVVDGEEWTRTPLHERAVGHVAQDPLLFPHLDVERNLLFSPRARGLDGVPEALGIGHLLDRMPRNLSGGERRRVALGRALLSRPRLLLLDEPFAGLDDHHRREAAALLIRVLAERGVPMVLVSHSAEEVVGLADRCVRLEGGRITAEGPSVAVLRSGETRVDSFLEGTVREPGTVEVEGVRLFASMPPGTRGRVRLACSAHEVILAAVPPERLSARNVLPVEVLAVEPAGDAVLVSISPPRIRAALTVGAVESLGLRPGTRCWAVVKERSFVHLAGVP
jgi:molybdate transport system ATP-binding protein